MVVPETTLGVVRARGPRSDTPRLRSELTRALTATELRPSQLPRNATLIVRKVGAAGRRPFDPERTSDSGWGDGLRDEVSAWYGRASRPRDGALPSEAEAVVFADDTELLACLAVDLAARRAGSRWWWAQLPSRFRGGLADVLAANAPLVPVAMDRMSGWGGAGTVVESLHETDAFTVLRAVARAYDLPTGGRVRPGSGSAGDATRSGGGDGGMARGSRWWEPWLGIDSVPPTSTKTHAALLAVSLLLVRRPAAARRPEVLATLRELAHEPDPRGAAPLAAGAAPHEGHARATDPASGLPSREPGDLAVSPARAVRDGTREGDGPAGAGTTGDEVAASEADTGASPTHGPSGLVPHGPREPSSHPTDVPPDRDAGAAADHPVVGRGSHAGPTADVAATGSEANAPPPRDPDELGAEPFAQVADGPGSGWDPGAITAWGGVLYLVNVIEHLDLPVHFEAGWRLDTGTGAWGLLEMLARGLVGDRASTVAADPLWRVLAELDGRPPGQLPPLLPDGGGAGAPGASVGRVSPRVTEPSYRLPPAWWRDLGAEADEGWWAATGERLWVWSGAPIVLVSCGRTDEDPATQATSELATYRSREAPPPRRRSVGDVPLATAGPLLDGLGPLTRRWLSLITPYLRARLAVALGDPAIDHDAAGPEATDRDAADPDANDLDTVLLRRRARIVTTRTHVDVVLDLADTSLPVRLAGLDGSPGWCPRFGRVVTYHFEEGGP